MPRVLKNILVMLLLLSQVSIEKVWAKVSTSYPKNDKIFDPLFGSNKLRLIKTTPIKFSSYGKLLEYKRKQLFEGEDSAKAYLKINLHQVLVDYLPTTGGTLTGGLGISSANPSFLLNRPSKTSGDSWLYFSQNNTVQFLLGTPSWSNNGKTFGLFNQSLGAWVFKTEDDNLITTFTESISSKSMLASSKFIVDDAYSHIEMATTQWGASHGIFFGSKIDYTGTGNFWESGNTKYAQSAGTYGYGAFSMGLVGNGGDFTFYDGGISTGIDNVITWKPTLTIKRGGNISVATPAIFNDNVSIGIGTASPTEKLQVLGAGVFGSGGYGQLKIGRDDGTYLHIENPSSDRVISLDASNRYVQAGYNTDFQFANNTGIWKHDGNVGIGTTNTPEKLCVNGNIKTKKIIVTQQGWPDYVFENTYKLLPLQDLENYIQKNKHLPDVPSATEVAKNGIDLGDNQALLLRKIEDLTLYVIEQQKKIEVLQKKSMDQQNEITTLKKKN